ncbi:hypothetical protein [Pseudoalteromonas sp. MTN2-4]|uniref:hypothetical protein n=1 Tax=Pseudoalteromonas sp. MTN2-4 TaxID=3056555 RepID=UPI0036F1C6A7
MNDIPQISELVEVGHELIDDYRGGAVARMKAEHEQTLQTLETEKQTALSKFNEDTSQAVQEVESLKTQVMTDNNQQLAEFKAKYQGSTALDLLTMPINKNAFLIADESGDPLHGYGSAGDINISAVHPYTKGFEGPYLENPPANVATSLEAATESTPFYFGRHFKGPRVFRGGLFGGWGGLPTNNHGHLLKVHKPAGEQHSYLHRLLIPVDNLKRSKVRLRGYVYISKGPLSFNAGVVDSNTKVNVPSAGEWHFIDEIINSSTVTFGYCTIVLGHAEECEMYFAMLNIHAVQGDSNATLINREF